MKAETFDIDKLWKVCQLYWYSNAVVHNPNYIDWNIGKNHDKHQRYKANKRRKRK